MAAKGNRVAATIGVGSYTSGESDLGFSIFTDDGAGWSCAQVLPIANASFAVRSGGLVLVLSESAPSALTSITRRDGRYEFVDRVDLHEAGACHVGFFGGDDVALVTNYVSGSVTAVPIRAGGALGPPSHLRLGGTPGPVSGRQDSPHPHQVLMTTWGTALISDLGCDRLLEVAFGASSDISLRREIALPPGSGPRHMAWSGPRLFVTGELDSRLHVLRVGPSVVDYLGSSSTVSVSGTAAPDISQPSHVALSDDGSALFVANRGPNTIARFTLQSPLPQMADETATGGGWPRHFLELDRRVFVANQHSHSVSQLDYRGGRLVPTDDVIAVDAPACLIAL